MNDPIEINRRNWDERAIIHARDATGFYRLDRVRSNQDGLDSIEAAELGDISQNNVLHLQCHIGTDTLRLVRLGAIATGLDFSAEAIRIARRLAEDAGLKVDFVQGRVDEAPRLAPGPFDLVYSTWGTICWLPDLTVWARVIAAVLAPGGDLYFADAHPSFLVMEARDGKLEPVFDFQTPVNRPLEFVSETTYTGDPTVMTHQSTREWIHPLSAIMEALIGAGLTIKMFHEHEVLPWQGLPIMIPTADGLWRLPDGHPRFPLSFSLRARRE
ncbi:methyltransferase domain-containing protein [Bradyrhizobium sp. CIAT3101]|uniref:class I SAM-dependent methyltransferase n=1 Tax=Bradyrhizobium sp. CIAT3101 TaxID=439387 RepID=UPI0024B069B7|nr:class I SAM-dependent methyltransferase [Bradyrhizobium sp. CIAT3101]WFU78179.1 methyltransferase domain-containing protein [Bradyrhizobium sp. CIAT3101]